MSARDKTACGVISMKKLTVRYSFTQFFYWMAICGGGSFATIFLIGKGMPSGTVGLILAVSGVLSGLAQPFMGAIADRASEFIVPQMLQGMTLLCCLCYAAQLVPHIPLAVSGVMYAVAICGSGAMAALLNVLSVAYDKAGYSINYGIGRGIGAAATALASLILGGMIARFGSTWMILFVLAGWVLFLLTLIGYPRIEKYVAADTKKQKNGSFAAFFGRYPRYSISLAGILLLGMYHTMTETYMIAIMENLGGNSSHVGIALFISGAVTFPVICIYGKIRRFISSSGCLKAAAVSYVVKSVCFYFAPSISAIFLFQLIQITSYALLEPTQVYYAKERVQAQDMAKGQAFIAASFALGGSAGNFIGGCLLDFGISSVLIFGMAAALLGMIIVMAFTSDTENKKKRI